MNVLSSISVCIQTALATIKGWGSNFRMIMLALMLAVTAAQFSAEVSYFAQSIGTQTNLPAILPHLYNNRYSRLCIQMGIILLFSNAPFKTENSVLYVIRTGYSRWCIGQLLYIAAASAVYVVCLILFTAAFAFPTLGISETWGRTFATLAQSRQISYTVSYSIQLQYSPFEALFHTSVLLFLLSLVLGMLMFMLSSVVGKGAGVIAASAVVLLGIVPSFSQYPALFCRFSPCSLTQIALLDNSGITAYPDMKYAYIFLCSAALLLTAANCVIYCSRKVRHRIYGTEV